MIKKAWQAWKDFGEKVSIVANTILLSVVYIIIITPMAILRKLFMKKKHDDKTYWKDFGQEDKDDELRRQF